MEILRGIPASGGQVVGRVHRLVPDLPSVPHRELAADEVAPEVDRFLEAVAEARRQIQVLVERLEREVGPDSAAILGSHLLILEDELIVDATLAIIRDRDLNAEAALAESVRSLVARLGAAHDPVQRERVQDLVDVQQRLLRILTGRNGTRVAGPGRPSVVVAEQLAPSDTAALGAKNVLAFVLGEGSRTSHVAILARSLGVPAVVGLGADLARLTHGELVAVDGDAGEVLVAPDSGTIARFHQLSDRARKVSSKLRHLRDLPAVTPDGHRVALQVNIELPVEVDKALECGAEGIGLLRTEYVFFQHGTLPSEEEQLAVYRQILAGMAGRPVVFRTLDVGGDKVQRYLGARRESNPFLGSRGIRFLLANPALLKSQLRAIYRAAADGPARLMFPMITGVAELRAARAACRACCEELAREGLPHDPDIPVGIMVETPSAALVADRLARECDFFSVGTNDLIQYTLAMDRLNERVAYLYQPLHPAVLRSLHGIVRAAHGAGIPVGMCGEMASETRFAELLLGLGFDSLSVHAAQLPKIKQVIRWTSTAEARELTDALLACATCAEAESLLGSYLETRKALRRRREEAEHGRTGS